MKEELADYVDQVAVLVGFVSGENGGAELQAAPQTPEMAAPICDPNPVKATPTGIKLDASRL